VEQAKSKRAAQAEATRDHLLVTARDVFADRGFHNTSVGAITSAAETAHGTFYLYFRNKDDVFAAVVQNVVLEMYDTMTFDRSDLNGRAYLDRTLRNLLQTYVKHAPIWRCLLEAVFTSSAIEAMWREMRAGFVNQMAKSVMVFQQKGSVRAVDPLIAANAIAAMFEWTATTSFVLRMPPVDDVDFDKTVEVLADLCYHALATSVVAPTPDT
jgi:AcrR family transcriptional regulator